MPHPRLLAVLIVASLAFSACAYETVGTTTTTTIAEDESPPVTSPASITFEGQRIEGSSVVLESVTLPSTGFVALRNDVAGAPGELIGLSEVIGPGRIEGVPVAFFVPLDADAIVHATVHVDMDRNRSFLYEPPDSFVDVPATLGDGQVATAAAEVVLLPPLGPAEIAAEEQRLTGTELRVTSVTLPAAGFVAVQRNEAGLPGTVLGATGLLAEGTSGELIIELDPPLRTTTLVWIVAYVDRDEDGVLSIDDGDEPAESIDGSAALVSPVMTVVPLDPSLIAAEDQEGEGGSIVVAAASLPSPGYIEVLDDRGGSPGSLLGRTDLLTAATVSGLEIPLERPITADTSVWLRIVIDFDGDQTLSPDDPIGLTEDGDPAQTAFTYTFVEPPDPDDEDDDQ